MNQETAFEKHKESIWKDHCRKIANTIVNAHLVSRIPYSELTKDLNEFDLQEVLQIIESQGGDNVPFRFD
jgi:hypothetical protein